MSNLWKALRDVSRDVDPTIGFEPPAQGSRADGADPVPHDSEPSGAAQDAASDPPQSARPTPRRPLTPSQPRPSSPQSAVARDQLAQLQSPSPRATGLADGAVRDNVVRPPQFTGSQTRPVGPAKLLSQLSQVLDAPQGPSLDEEDPPGRAANGTGPAAAPPGGPASSQLRSIGGPAPTEPRTIGGPGLARPRSVGPAAGPAPAPVAAPAPAAGGTIPAPTPTTAPAAPRRPSTPSPTPNRPEMAQAPAQAAPRGPATAPPSRDNGGRGSEPVSPSPRLPEALRAFAPEAPNTQAEVASMLGAPRWRPGDDDVLPGDGHRGATRPRLRDRLGW